jgi:prohibitin 2
LHSLTREQAVEAKQVAQQEAERAKFIVEKAIQDKQVTKRPSCLSCFSSLLQTQALVIKAEGEAQAAKLIGDQVLLVLTCTPRFLPAPLLQIRQKPGFIQLRRIEASREIAHIIAKSHNKVYLNADSLLLSLNADGQTSDSAANAKK